LLLVNIYFTPSAIPLKRTLDLHHDHPCHYPCQDVNVGEVTEETERETERGTDLDNYRDRQRDKLKQKYRDILNIGHTDVITYNCN